MLLLISLIPFSWSEIPARYILPSNELRLPSFLALRINLRENKESSTAQTSTASVIFGDSQKAKAICTSVNSREVRNCRKQLMPASTRAISVVMILIRSEVRFFRKKDHSARSKAL
ncbi:hypothetical protein D3C81_1724900 [compost metagenome]